MPINHLNQPIGETLTNYSSGQQPNIQQLIGRYTIVEPISLKHFDDAYRFYGTESSEAQWTYLPINAFKNQADFRAYFEKMTQSHDPYYLAIVDKVSGKTVGTFSLMRIDTANRVIEMGWVLYGDELKQSRLATEAQFLVMQYVFEVLQYRRYEWKCDSLNAPSNQAAKRLGFHFEGTFRRALVYKNRTRDTNWYSMIEEEYQAMKPKFEHWLQPENFDENGQQRTALNDK